jgi:hypothetical protein
MIPNHTYKMYIGVVCGPLTDAHQGITWKTCTRVRWAWLDSLIVIANYCQMWGLCDHVCVILSGGHLQGVN